MPEKIQIINEDFSNLNNWESFGSPSPTIATVAGESGLKVNGDSSYRSGVISTNRFPSKARIEFEMNVYEGCSSCDQPWEVVSFGITQDDSNPGSYASPSALFRWTVWGKVPSGDYARDYMEASSTSTPNVKRQVQQYGWFNVKIAYDWNNGNPFCDVIVDGDSMGKFYIPSELIGDSFHIFIEGRSYYNNNLVKDLVAYATESSNVSLDVGSPIPYRSLGVSKGNNSLLNAAIVGFVSDTEFYSKHILGKKIALDYDGSGIQEEKAELEIGEGSIIIDGHLFILCGKGTIAISDKDFSAYKDLFIELPDALPENTASMYISRRTGGVEKTIMSLYSGKTYDSSPLLDKKLAKKDVWPGYFYHSSRYGTVEKTVYINNLDMENTAIYTYGSKMCSSGDITVIRISVDDEDGNTMFSMYFAPTSYSGNSVTLSFTDDSGAQSSETITGYLPGSSNNGELGWQMFFIRRDGRLIFVARPTVGHGIPRAEYDVGPVDNFSKLLTWKNRTTVYGKAYGTYYYCTAQTKLAISGTNFNSYQADSAAVDNNKIAHYVFKNGSVETIKATGSESQNTTSITSFTQHIGDREETKYGLIGTGYNSPFDTGIPISKLNDGITFVVDFVGSIDESNDYWERYQYIFGNSDHSYNSGGYGLTVSIYNQNKIKFLTVAGSEYCLNVGRKDIAIPGSYDGWNRMVVSLKYGHAPVFATAGSVMIGMNELRSVGLSNNIALCSFYNYGSRYAKSAIIGEFAAFDGYVFGREALKFLQSIG